MKIQITIVGKSPLLMHNPRLVDPQDEIVKTISTITSKRKKTDDDLKEKEKLEWYGGLYRDGDIVVQPCSKLRKCLIEAARISKLGKQIERGLSFDDLNVPLVYDGPKNIDELWNSGKFVSRLSVGVNGTKRVMRVRPQFSKWSLTMTGLMLEDVLNLEDLKNIANTAGRAIGIGDNRVNGYGRFDAAIKVLS